MITKSIGELTDLACKAFCGLGLQPDDAIDAATILVLAERFGVVTHGLNRIPQYGERLAVGGINVSPTIRVSRPAQSLLVIDGDNGVGPLVGKRALDAAMKVATETGSCVAFVRGSNHFGPIFPYAHLAAEAGLASMVFSNATTTIAPWGGRDARLGNNPMGFGVPGADGRHVILDIALSVAARAKIRRAAEQGETLPDGWATDAEGRPTRDPQAALAGFLLPIGGHKGYGLSLIVDLFAGLLSGAAFLTHVRSWVVDPEMPQNLGHFMLLIDIARLRDSERHATLMDDFSGIIHATPAADPANPVRLPGEHEYALLRRTEAVGVQTQPQLIAQLEALAQISGDEP